MNLTPNSDNVAGFLIMLLIAALVYFANRDARSCEAQELLRQSVDTLIEKLAEDAHVADPHEH